MIAPLTLWVIAFTVGLIDILKKERKKVLSIITVAVSGVPIALFLLVLLIIMMY